MTALTSLVHRARCSGVALTLALAAAAAHAGAIDTLQSFVRDVKSGHAEFTQTVTSPDGKKKRVSKGLFEFQRPTASASTTPSPMSRPSWATGRKCGCTTPTSNR